MNIERRTVLPTLVGAVVWAFFFVPNGFISFLDVQGNERLPTIVLFGVIPVSLGLLLSLVLKSGRGAAVLIAGAVPMFGIAAILALWASGYYSSEGLLGAWGYCLVPIPAYALGVVIGLLVRIRMQYTASS
ncbi:MAG TPA: hypothetical protein VFC18_04800 [Burkholderiales bacterium]|nr:hypothetical protein [Burkholderiales bacterium]